MERIIFALVIIGMTLLLQPSPANCAADDAERGATLYRQNCLKCHSSPAKMAVHQDIVSYIRKPRFKMPRFGPDKLTDDEARLIENYIKLWAEKK